MAAEGLATGLHLNQSLPARTPPARLVVMAVLVLPVSWDVSAPPSTGDNPLLSNISCGGFRDPVLDFSYMMDTASGLVLIPLLIHHDDNGPLSPLYGAGDKPWLHFHGVFASTLALSLVFEFQRRTDREKSSWDLRTKLAGRLQISSLGDFERINSLRCDGYTPKTF